MQLKYPLKTLRNTQECTLKVWSLNQKKTYEEEAERLKSEMKKMGFEILDQEDPDKVYASIDFVTSENNRFSVFAHMTKTSLNGESRFGIQKGHRPLISSFHSEAKNPENAVDNILEKAKKYISTMAQNLTAGQKEMDEIEGDPERKYSKDGVPYLFPNETLSDYFHKQDMPAGLVINGKGRYQRFHSYMTYENKMIMHYDTKDYANKKNASKALEKLGFSPEGKQLELDSIKEMQENVSEMISRNMSSSWGEDSMGSAITKEAIIDFSPILKEEDEKFGFKYFSNVTITERMTGRKLTERVDIDAREGGNTFSIGKNLEMKAKDLIEKIKDNTIEFEPDLRTNEEKYKFHNDQSNSHKRMINHYETQLKTNTNPHYEESAQKSLSWEIEMLKAHIDMAREIENTENSFTIK